MVVVCLDRSGVGELGLHLYVMRLGRPKNSQVAGTHLDSLFQ